jgi:hypothetical protein
MFIFNTYQKNNNCWFNKFEIFKNPIFQNHIRSKPFPHLNGWILVIWGFHGNFIVELHGGHKKIRLLFKQHMI